MSLSARICTSAMSLTRIAATLSARRISNAVNFGQKSTSTRDVTAKTRAISNHEMDVFKRVAIAMELTVEPDGWKSPNDGGVTYDKLRHDVMLVRTLLHTGKFVSYDMLFMQGVISLTEAEFNAVKKLTSYR